MNLDNTKPTSLQNDTQDSQEVKNNTNADNTDIGKAVDLIKVNEAIDTSANNSEALPEKNGVEEQNEISNVDLFTKYFEVFGPKELLKVGENMGLNTIPGFSSLENAISKSPQFARNKILAEIKKRCGHSNANTLDEYEKVKTDSLPSYRATLLLDLHANYNVDIVRKLIIEDELIPSLVVEAGEASENITNEEIEKLQQTIDQQNDKIEELEQKNRKLNKELAKQENTLKKKLKEDADKKHKAKVGEIEAKHSKDIGEINAKLDAVISDYKKLSAEYDDYKKEIEKKSRYFEKIFKRTYVIMLDMQPINDKYFPYPYEVATISKLLTGDIENTNFTEVWVQKDMLDGLRINFIKAKAREYGHQCLVSEMKLTEIQELGLEVLR